jgi:putative MATE family efflux protein
MIFAPLGIKPLLRLLDTPVGDVTDMAVTYINILLWGCLGVASYNILSGILRGLGDSFSPFIYLVIASVLSAGLNLLFVGVFKWGIAGAAMSTVFCQLLSGVLCLRRLMKMRNIFDMDLKYLRPVKLYIMQVVRLGLPTGASQAVFSLAMVMVQSLVNSFGRDLMSANTIVMKIDGFIIMPIFTFANAIMAYTGQNVGAGKFDRVKQGARQCMFMSVGLAVVLVIGLFLFAYPLTGMFTDTPEVRDLSVTILRILAIGYVFLAVGQVYWGVLRGAGDTITPMWAAFIITIIRVPTAYLFVRLLLDVPGIYEAMGIPYSAMMSWVLGSVMGVLAYRFGKWRSRGLV